MSLLIPLRAFGLIHDATLVGLSMIQPIQVEVAAECLDATPPIPPAPRAHHGGLLAGINFGSIA
jgi:hypothetical protein